jgi:predicted kinase
VGTRRPTLILIGGFPGTGKTVLSSRLSLDLGVPRLDPDLIGLTIRHHESFCGSSADAWRIAYAVLWRACVDLLGSHVSVIVDANMAYEESWQSVDAIRMRCQKCSLVAVLLRSPLEICLERISLRNPAAPGLQGDADSFMDDRGRSLWDYRARLNRPDVRIVDSDRPLDEVCADVKEHIADSL